MKYRIHSMILSHEWSELKAFDIISVLSTRDMGDGSFEITALIGEEWYPQ